MKFDTARANAIFEKLGDPAFTGPNSEGQIADFVAGEFERMGWKVERREVEGSRFPQRAGPWIGWLGYGVLSTLGYALMLRGDLIAAIGAIVAMVFSFHWVNALVSNRIRPGSRLGRRETAPLVRGSLACDHSPPVRVVFQSVLGGIKTDFFQQFRFNRFFPISIFTAILFFLMAMTTLAAARGVESFSVAKVAVSSVFFVLAWVMILCVLCWEYRQARLPAELRAVDRHGLAVLLELARSWPRNRSRQIEPIFIAAGGQLIDYAGSREVVRMLESEWPRKPTLLVLFFAPGAGDAVRIAENALRTADLRGLAKKSAESLWIPIWGDDPCTLFPFWPFETHRASEPIALIGSDPMAFFDSSVSREALHRPAQLAMEIALRWAKKETMRSPAPGSSSSKSESPNERGHENS